MSLERSPRRTEDAMIGRTDAIANVAVKNLASARRFYEDTLGLKPIHDEAGELVVYESGRSQLNVYASKYAGTNKATAVTWEVDDVDAEVSELKAKGVTFEHYDMPDTKLEGDVHVAGDMRIAWFKDPDGNILPPLRSEAEGLSLTTSFSCHSCHVANAYT
jgi:catechol 2,3-dioxygenase-like lactoylglutathione lyase family enzyme